MHHLVFPLRHTFITMFPQHNWTCVQILVVHLMATQTSNMLPCSWPRGYIVSPFHIIQVLTSTATLCWYCNFYRLGFCGWCDRVHPKIPPFPQILWYVAKIITTFQKLSLYLVRSSSNYFDDGIYLVNLLLGGIKYCKIHM